MVKVLLCLFSLFYASICAAQTDFAIHISQHQLELGKHLTLTLSASPSSARLDTIDLSKLRPLFHIDPYSEVETEEGRQIWKLRLSPYNKGKQTIPVLHFNDLKSESVEITVTDAIDPKSNRPLTINYSVSNTAPWVREQILAIYTLSSSLKLYDISLNEEPDSFSTELHRLSTLETNLHDRDTNLFQYQTGYALFNLSAGQHIINLPPLVLKLDGTTTHRFYPPPFTLTVKSLPLYLPATIPVGNLTLKTGKPFQFNLTHRLTKAEFELSASQIQFSSLPNLNHQLNSTDSLRTYPAAIEESKINGVDGLTNKIHYTLPLKPTRQGIHTLPPIRLLNFDPTQGTLQTAEYTLPGIISLNIWISLLLILFFALASLFVAFKLYQYIYFQLKRYRYYQLALKQLATADNQQSIRSALNAISQAEGLNLNITPEQWLSHFASESTVKTLREPLNQFFYQQPKKPQQTEHMDLASLKQLLSQTIKARHNLLF